MVVCDGQRRQKPKRPKLILVAAGCEKHEEQVVPQTKSDRNARFDPAPFNWSGNTVFDPSFLNSYSLANGQPSVSPADAAFRNDYDKARGLPLFVGVFPLSECSVP